MDAIEPHWISLLWFAVLVTICTVAFLVVAGKREESAGGVRSDRATR